MIWQGEAVKLWLALALMTGGHRKPFQSEHSKDFLKDFSW